jgi:hypothetical protein
MGLRANTWRVLGTMTTLVIVTAACGSAGDSSPTALYVPQAVAACLESHGAAVLQINPQDLAGDTSGGAFRVEVGGHSADVAFAATDAKAGKTAKLARSIAKKRRSGGRVRHRGNVAYWALDKSMDPLNEVGKCLK